MAEPPFRWVGGKRALLTSLREHVPLHKRYFEPFVGGGALFFSLATDPGLQQAFLSDANEDLTNTYIMLRDHTEDVIWFLELFSVRATRVGPEPFYYELRDRHGRSSTPFGAARFLYLMAACFNGLYRVNQQGEFNVAFGRNDMGEPKTIRLDYENILACAEALQIADIRTMNYRFIAERVEDGDFVYADPPYATPDKAHYTGYTRNRFSWGDQEELAAMMHTFARRGASTLVSQPFDEGILALYQRFVDPVFRVSVVSAPRNVSANGKTRGKTRELLLACP